MTSFIIDTFQRRAEQINDHLASAASTPMDAASDVGSSSKDNKGKQPVRGDCIFCDIVSRSAPAFIVYEDEHAIAFLDIYYIRRGHLLLLPINHHARLTDLPSGTSAHMASLLPPLSRALASALSNPQLTVVCNVGYGQVVDHVHWHLVPAPQTDPPSPPRQKQKSGWGGLDLLSEAMGRNELDEGDAKVLINLLRQTLAREGLKTEHLRMQG